MIVSFCAVLFPMDVLDELLDLIESVSEGFPTYFYLSRLTLKTSLNVYIMSSQKISKARTTTLVLCLSKHLTSELS